MSKNGFLVAGNWAINYNKIVDRMPMAYTFSRILNENTCNAGAAYNLVSNLTRLDSSLNIEAAGCVGQDIDGKSILEDCVGMGVNISRMRVLRDKHTAYTDIITVRKTGERYCFDKIGANAQFSGDRLNLKESNAFFFYLGSLLALPALEPPVGRFPNKAAKLLHAAQKLGMQTASCPVRNDDADYSIFRSVLPYLDYALLSEFEAEKLTGIDLRYIGSIDSQAVEQAGNRLIKEFGVKKAVAIAFRDAGYVCTSDGESHLIGDIRLPREMLASTVGVNHAFQSGFLYAISRGESVEQSLRLAQCVKAASTTHLTASKGIINVTKCRALGQEYGFRYL